MLKGVTLGLFNQLLGDAAIISVQDPILIPPHSEPEPDIAVLRVAAKGLSPIELEVSGAGALAVSAGPGTRVDVVVTSEPGPGARGRTFVAAEAVELLGLVEGGGSDEDDPLAAVGAPPAYVATVAVRRSEALRLIQAENFARQIRLIPAR